MWRAGAHTDFDGLTLLHQRPGQGRLRVCPGAEVGSGGALGRTAMPPDVFDAGHRSVIVRGPFEELEADVAARHAGFR